MGKRKTILSLTKRHLFFSVLVPIILLGTIFAAHSLAQTFPPPTYFTGCIENSGKKSLYNASFGSTPPPTPSCNMGDSVATWISGDGIQSITAGAGLTGGDSSSEVTLSLADNGVTTPKLADNSVTANKIANTTRVITANLMGWNSESNIEGLGLGIRMMSTGITQAIYTFAIPYDYAGGDLQVKEWFRLHDNFGVAKMIRLISKLTTTGQTLLFSNEPADQTFSDNAYLARTYTIPGSSVSAGEIIYVVLDRYGDQAEDTAGRLDLMGAAIEYSADQ